jgi:hypothetical protein
MNYLTDFGQEAEWNQSLRTCSKNLFYDEDTDCNNDNDMTGNSSFLPTN